MFNVYRYRKYLHSYDNTGFDSIPEETYDNNDINNAAEDDVFYLNFTSSVQRNPSQPVPSTTLVPGPSTISDPGPSTISVLGPSISSEPGPSRRVVEEELQGIGGRISEVKTDQPTKERYMMSGDSSQPEFFDYPSARKMKYVSIIILIILLFAGLIAWLTVMVRF